MSVHAFFAEIGVELPDRVGEVPVRCFLDGHDERRASASVNTETGMWFCHVCDEGGRPYNAAIERGLAAAEAQGLAEKYGLWIENNTDDDPRARARANKEQKMDPLPTEEVLAAERARLLENDKLLERLKELRGWRRASVEELGLGFDGERILFPIRDAGGRLVNVVRYRPEGQPKTLALTGRARDLFPAPETITADTVWVTEGEPDVVAMLELGIHAVGIPGVAGWRRAAPERFADRRVVIALDADRPGREAADKLARALVGHAAEVRIVDIAPERADGSDVTDLLVEARANGGVRSAQAKLLKLAAAAPVVPGATVPAPLGDLALGTRFDTAKFKVLDVATMIASQPPAVPWMVDGLAVRGDVTILTGDPGAGKSLLALTLSGAVARGESIAGLACTEGSVVYLDAENGGREIHRRLHSLRVPLTGVTVIEADGVNLREDSDLEQLEAVIATFGPTMLVLDSLTALWPGANERRTEDVAPVLYGLKRLAEHHGVAIVVLHHRPKDGGEYRGTTAIAAAAQLGFTLSKAKGDPDRTRRRLGCWKCRPAAEPEDRWLHLDAEHGMVLVGEAQPYEDPDEPERTAPAKRELAPRFLGALGSSRRGLSEIASLLDMNPKDGTLRRVADHLVVTGKIVRGDDKKYEKCRVPGATGPKGVGTVALGTTQSRAETLTLGASAEPEVDHERMRAEGVDPEEWS